MLRIVTLWLAFVAAAVVSAAVKRAYPGGPQFMYRLTLKDKQQTPYSLDHPQRWLSQRSLERRRRQGLTLDSTDLPVTPRYVRAISAVSGVHVVGQSRWNNTVLARTADTTLVARLRLLPFVRSAELVWVSPDSVELEPAYYPYHEHLSPWDSARHERYGSGREQIETVGGLRLHAISLRGRGMTIAVLDGGFQNADRLPALRGVDIAGTRDLVWHNPLLPRHAEGDDEIYYATDHGTKVLSAMAADVPEVLTGTAPDARYWLLRCEDLGSEQPVEEDYWAMAAETADSAGVDVINSSLGYSHYDAPHRPLTLAQLDGRSTLISRTASMLASKGIILVSSAGNEGMGPWKKISVPADAHQILTVGALNPQGKNAPFSSVGPSQDGRVKPDVMAPGSPAALISGRGGLVRDMGTSFAAPVVSGLVACLWQAFPRKSAIDIISLVRKTADNHLTPNNVYGYGIPNFWKAYMVGKLENEK